MYHKLNSKVRHIFLLDLTTSQISFNGIVKLLREYYKFKAIPNDFFIQKPLLSKNPQDIKLNIEYQYLITDDKIAREFFDLATTKYKILFPINPEIIIANPTNKLRLSTDSNLITE